MAGCQIDVTVLVGNTAHPAEMAGLAGMDMATAVAGNCASAMVLVKGKWDVDSHVGYTVNVVEDIRNLVRTGVHRDTCRPFGPVRLWERDAFLCSVTVLSEAPDHCRRGRGERLRGFRVENDGRPASGSNVGYCPHYQPANKTIA